MKSSPDPILCVYFGLQGGGRRQKDIWYGESQHTHPFLAILTSNALQS